MTSSAPCKSSARRNELAKLFWKARVMQAFRDGRGHAFLIPEKVNSKALADYLFGDFDPHNAPFDTYPKVVFSFVSTYVGQEQLIAVEAEGYCIVLPFLRPDTVADTPLFPEELACSASL